MKCGFGREHTCERSVCCCDCHMPVLTQVETDPKMVAYLNTAMADLDYAA